jgi:subtilisin family serine protease
LKPNEPELRTFQTLVAGQKPEASANTPFERLLQSEHVMSVEPLFPDSGAGMATATERLVLAANDNIDEELSGLNVIHLRSPVEAKSAAAELNANDPNLAYAHVIQERFLQLPKKNPAKPVRSTRKPRNRRTSAPLPNDPLLNRQWGLRAVEWFQARQIGDFVDAPEVVIAVIDTGVDARHPDLRNAVFVEENFTTGPKQDVKGHGTHVIGIIAAIQNNNIGISGVCQSQKVMSLKALGPFGGSGYYRAIRFATDNGAQVINFSLGGQFDPTEELLIKRALKRGIVIVAAMGNDFRQNTANYPAAIAGVVAVGASTEIDRRANFSQTGKHICLMAPGTNILSTVPTYPSELAATTDYDAWPGTSMAAPFVTAAAALMLARRPTATLEEITRALQTGADKIGGSTHFSEEYGHGRLNLRRSLAAI